MNLEPKNIYERLVSLGDDMAESAYAADLLEEMKKHVVAKLCSECSEKSAAAKETYAHAHPDYKGHIEKMVKTREAATKARVRYDSARIWAEMMRTQSANERASLRGAP